MRERLPNILTNFRIYNIYLDVIIICSIQNEGSLLDEGCCVGSGVTENIRTLLRRQVFVSKPDLRKNCKEDFGVSQSSGSLRCGGVHYATVCRQFIISTTDSALL
ncbi:UNVERIFIED_CONTAM: hypothetical protein NCL1_44767 [Trichonephila clavipes]